MGRKTRTVASDLLIGIDFDNTIICYDGLFHQIALEDGLIPGELPAEKNAVRDYLRERGREEKWTEMQGIIYGKRITEAEPYPGIDLFLAYCHEAGIATCIVSHKTKYPYLGPKYDLHDAGYCWLRAKGFLDEENTGLSSRQVYFELTKEEKIARISTLGCTHFIDDLPEILLSDGMPRPTKKILFDPRGGFQDMDGICRMTSWREITVRIEQEVARP
ncbi:MAG: hypothetical protein CSYNP_01514 [Syntrophus sp. SKADARSKE-3]|nr:hypothetical protein [Syntrophus sp. SKADARSKE-3]